MKRAGHREQRASLRSAGRGVLCALVFGAALGASGCEGGVSGPSDGGAERPDAGDAGDDCVDVRIPAGRPSSVTCSACRPPGPGSLPGSECGEDLDCTDGRNGRCYPGMNGLGLCSYDECMTDADCGAEEVCACDGGPGDGNACVPSDCRLDSDCGDGRACAPSSDICGSTFPLAGFYCQQPGDSCLTDEECGIGFCVFDEASGIRVCRTGGCP